MTPHEHVIMGDYHVAISTVFELYSYISKLVVKLKACASYSVPV